MKEPKKQLSGKTLYYMAQYGKGHHLAGHIFKSSVKVLIFASIVSSFGGVGLQEIQSRLVAVLPLMILLPALTDMVGDFGTIASTKFTTAVYLGKVRGRWWKSKYTYRLFTKIMLIALFAAIYISVFSYAIAIFQGFEPDSGYMLVKITQITLISTVSLVTLIFTISVASCKWLLRRGEEPDNTLIPLTTSIADFGSLLLFSFLVASFI